MQILSLQTENFYSFKDRKTLHLIDCCGLDQINKEVAWPLTKGKSSLTLCRRKRTKSKIWMLTVSRKVTHIVASLEEA